MGRARVLEVDPFDIREASATSFQRLQPGAGLQSGRSP
jgi:hypothetical protein